MSGKIFDHRPPLYRYTALGCYPLAYLDTTTGDCLCATCATEEIQDYEREQPAMFEQFANWEDPNLYCAGCSEHIESAYAEPEEVES